MMVVKIAGGIKKNVTLSEAVTLEWEPMTVRQLLSRIEVDEKQVGAVLVNGQPKKMNYALSTGDEVQVLPVLSGG